MQLFAALSFALWLGLSLPMTTCHKNQESLQDCLPPDIKLSDIVSTEDAKPGKETGAIKQISVRDKLTEMKARCDPGKLVDRTGREIRFYRLAGCWGNPPADYLEILDQQSKELERLKKQYTVIEMTCNPSGIQPH